MYACCPKEHVSACESNSALVVPWYHLCLEDFKVELANYHKDQRKYDKDKATVFVLIVGQCTDVVKRTLESDPDFMTLRVSRDVKGLMKKLKALAFSQSTNDNPVTAVVNSVRRIAPLQQGTHESVINYSKQFSTACEVLEEQWGVFGPPALAASASDADLNTAKQKFLGRLFLLGSDKRRFSKLVDTLHNSFQAGKDDYPESLDATLSLLSNYQDHQSEGGQISDVSSGEGHGASFALKSKKLSKIRCFECNEYRHFKKDCPKMTASHVQHSSQVSSLNSAATRTINPWTA